MNFEKLTIKAQQAVQQAVDRAMSLEQQAVTPVHLLAGVLQVGENVTQFIFGKLGVNEHVLQTAIDNELKHQPRVSGGQPYLSTESDRVMVQAEKTATANGDTYVGLEPLLMALLEVKSVASQMLKDAGVSADGLKTAIQELRGGKKRLRRRAKRRIRRCKNMRVTWWRKHVTANSTR